MRMMGDAAMMGMFWNGHGVMMTGASRRTRRIALGHFAHRHTAGSNRHNRCDSLSGCQRSQKQRDLQQQKHAPLSNFRLSNPTHQHPPHAKTRNGLPENLSGAPEQIKPKQEEPPRLRIAGEKQGIRATRQNQRCVPAPTAKTVSCSRSNTS